MRVDTPGAQIDPLSNGDNNLFQHLVPHILTYIRNMERYTSSRHVLALRLRTGVGDAQDLI